MPPLLFSYVSVPYHLLLFKDIKIFQFGGRNIIHFFTYHDHAIIIFPIHHHPLQLHLNHAHHIIRLHGIILHNLVVRLQGYKCCYIRTCYYHTRTNSKKIKGIGVHTQRSSSRSTTVVTQEPTMGSLVVATQELVVRKEKTLLLLHKHQQ